MLVLSRRPNESIRIGNGIIVTVVSVKGNRVKLGICAPPEVPVDRTELRAEKVREEASPVMSWKCATMG